MPQKRLEYDFPTELMPFLGDLGSNALGTSHGPFRLAVTKSDDNVPRGTILKILPGDLEPHPEMK